ncbi:PREDICTED: kinesin-like protein KIF23 [Priapulus caudatus]|uniref:Kinesin-like protein n=1 Tax=Priapulus caudatus TaxID=37621 RepID=A0ABM1E2Z4_PRICU|nr:PREDICTED: kinesin-like protein KIF23 [Priapulus caudatus]
MLRNKSRLNYISNTSAMKPTRGKTPKKTPKRLKTAPKDPVEVYCRLRPLESGLTERCCAPTSSTILKIWPPESSQTFKSGNYKELDYGFKFVFDEESSQKGLYDHVALPLVDDLLHGKNGLLFTYGITGSGKTHAMTGTPQDGGILPRCLDVIFNSIGELQAYKYVFKPDKANLFEVQTEADAMLERQERDVAPPTIPKTPTTPRRPRGADFEYGSRVPDHTKITNLFEDNVYAVFVSYVEIYNNYVYDLLEETEYDGVKPRPPQSKVMREDANRNMYVSGAVEVEIKSTEEAFEVLLKGQKRRRVAHTVLNTESSRSHSVFNIRLVQAPSDPVGEEVLMDGEAICVSQMSLVDLAGSERTHRTNNSGDRLREAGNINTSLMTLRTCIETLRENQMMGTNKLVPYRDSKVTHLFKNYFDGEGKVRMIVCVNPAGPDYEETLHVMKFAQLTQEVQVTRPTEIMFDVGLAPGRRRANQMYKDAMKKAEEDGTDVDLAVLPIPLQYSLGPPFPQLEISDAADGSVLVPLVQFLVDRQNRRNTLLRDLAHKQTQFRNDLVTLENERNHYKSQAEYLTTELDAEQKKSDRLERQLKQYQKYLSEMERANLNSEADKVHLQYELDDKRMKITQEQMERDRLKNKYRSKIDLERERMSKEMEKRVKMTEEELKSKMWEREEKLRAVKEILASETPVRRPGGKAAVAPPTGARATANTPRFHAGRVKPAQSEPRLNFVGSRVREFNNQTPTSRPGTKLRSRSPPPKGSAPVVNIRHRRSRSTGADTWLDHRPPGNIETGTVLQKKLRNKKSVSQLEVQDTQRSSKYLLTHQEQQADGNVETRLIKGDCLPTAGGGTAVVFNDVEVLRQTSPGSRKRRSDPDEDMVNGVDGDWTDIETRCATGIEGHHGRITGKRTKV